MPDFPLIFPSPWGPSQARATLRAEVADFEVDEHLGFEPSGSGEHIMLRLEKEGENTGWIAREIALLAGVKENDVGYCGLKDRHAITRQWFSVYLPKGAEPDWQALQSSSVRLLQVSRHSHKLRRGQHQANSFRLRLRDWQGERDIAEQQLAEIAHKGVPNYFGPQRFGRNAGNLHMARQWFEAGEVIRHRQKKVFALSAARAWLFNCVLAERVQQQNWSVVLPGEVPDAAQRPTGPMWGRGRSLVTDEVLALEQKVLKPWQLWCEGMEFTGLQQERRSLVLLPENLQWQWQAEQLQVSFTLPPGAFATALLAAFVDCQQGTDETQIAG